MTPVAYVSVPRVSRLDPLDESKHRHDTAVALDFPEDISTRITFTVELAPLPLRQNPETYGAVLSYELYSAIVRIIPMNFSSEMSEFFLHGMPLVGQFEKRQIDRVHAELEFHQRIHGRSHIIFRENSGAYVFLAAKPMRTAPQLKIAFNRDDLHIEQIPFAQNKELAHKVRFWICDKGGRNKKDDLRQCITMIQLNSEIGL